MRAPTASDLAEYVCRIQPELDHAAAARILELDEGLREIMASAWTAEQANAASLLELHLSLEESAPA